MELNEAGYPCSVKNMENLIYSDFSFSYHPIREYMNHLPPWDGIDHIGCLAESVHTIPAQREFWLKGFRNFPVGMVAAATQEEVVNHLCLLLCSKQNPEKPLSSTTFCRVSCEPIISAPASSPPETRTTSPACRNICLSTSTNSKA